MGRFIHCLDCKNTMSETSKKYGELYEFLQGTALTDLRCDGSCGDKEAKLIKKGDVCFAAVLLNNKFHPNYQAQKPENWAGSFIKVTNGN